MMTITKTEPDFHSANFYYFMPSEPIMFAGKLFHHFNIVWDQTHCYWSGVAINGSQSYENCLLGLVMIMNEVKQ